MFRRAPLAVAAVLLAALIGCAPPPAEETQTEPVGTVTHVIDGDTIVVSITGTTERVRLIGIDTPEIAHEDLAAECYGPEATRRVEDLLPDGTRVRLTRDVEPRDQYGRLLAYVFRADDDLFVNLELAADGYAEPLTIPPNITYTAALRPGRRHGAREGPWACGQPAPRRPPTPDTGQLLCRLRWAGPVVGPSRSGSHPRDPAGHRLRHRANTAK